MDLMRSDPGFRDVNSDSQNKGLQAQLRIDRDKANLLGVQIADIRTALYDAFGERQVSTIYSAANSYLVILEASDADRRFGGSHCDHKEGQDLTPLVLQLTAEASQADVDCIEHDLD